MDPNNISGITVEDLNKSDFSEVSSVGANLKQILDKIKSLEAKVTQNIGQSGAGSSSSGFQIGEKFGELKGKIDGMNEKIEVLRTENVGLKEGMAKMKEEFEGKNAEKDHAMVELKNGMAQQKDGENIRLKIEIAEQKVKIAKLEDNNRAMKRKIERIETYFPKTKKVLINRRALPAELLSELFASLPMKNAFDILAKMPNGLLQRNMRKMLKSIEMAMRNNKWNEAQCGPKMAIFEGGLMVKHYGPNDWNSVRAQFAIPKLNLNANKSAFAYFEVEILAKEQNFVGIYIGFCTKQFPLEGKVLGHVENSIGSWHKGGIRIDRNYIDFVNGSSGYFQAVEVIGIGIVHFPANSTMKCFASCNGNLLGKTDLPIKFAALQLFPAVSMRHQNDSIRANFGSVLWKYNPILEHLAN